MANPIPRSQRELVWERDRGQCGRCGMKATDWHHRRSRRVRDEHTHCACVGVALCRTCHDRVHAGPTVATETGFIVSMHEQRPWTVPFRKFDGTTVWPTCDGGLEFGR